MDRKLGGLALFAVSSVAFSQECDWKTAEKVDPMTDQKQCIISSDSAKIGVAVQGERVMFLTTSAYRDGRDHLQLRIDENKAIYLGEHVSTTDFKDNARRALAEIEAGSRLRTSYRDYPSSKEGDAPICTLPELIRACR